MDSFWLAMRLKKRVMTQKSSAARELRRIERVRRRAEKLRAENSDVIESIVFKDPAVDWVGESLSLEVLRELPGGKKGYNRFSRAMSDLLFEVGVTLVSMLAATVMALAVRSARVKRPSPLEAAVLAVATGLEGPARTEHEQEQRVDTWKKRYGLVGPRVRELLLAYPRAAKHASYFVDGKLVPRRGGEGDDS